MSHTFNLIFACRMFSSSVDILYIVIALCVLWFTVFLCWLLYQAGRVLRNANNILETVSEKLELISEALHFIQKKVDGISSNMGLVGKMLSSLMEKFVIGKMSASLDEMSQKVSPKRKRRASKKKSKE